MTGAEMIDRYVHAVTRTLPTDSRSDVERELRANIADMLPDNPGLSDVRTTLATLGNPDGLADGYRQGSRYLIGPAVYETYVTVLRIVVLTLSGVTVFATLMAGFVHFPREAASMSSTISGLIGRALGAAFQGASNAFLWVTLIFAIMTRAGNMPWPKEREWSPDSLPPLPPTRQARISRGETVFAMCLLVVYASILFVRPDAIGFYVKEYGNWTVIPFFDVDRLRVYLPALAVLAFVNFGILAAKLVGERWSLPLAVVNAVYNICTAAVVCIMLGDMTLVNPDFRQPVMDAIEASAPIAANAVNWWKWWIVGVVVAGSVVDSVMGFVKGRA